MKQQITIDQLNELGKEEIAKLQSWYSKMPYNYVVFGMSEEPKIKARYTHPLLSIGQMIEFLAAGRRSYYLPGCSIGESEIDPTTWCDDLWEEVKKVLEGKNA